jgi:hypothetical protein
MKETEITIRVYNRDRRTEDERIVTAYADNRFPGLALHGPWELTDDEWRVTHAPSGLIVASLPTRAAATAALEMIGILQDWNRPLPEVAAHGEPGKARWLKAAVAAAVERVHSGRAAALETAVKSGAIKTAALEAALGTFHCRNMRRAWRNRSPVTHGDWSAPARKLLGEAADLADVRKLAAALYAAASDFSPGGLFAPAAWPPHTWKQLSGRLRTYRAELPEKALSRGQYEKRRKAARKPTKAV